MIFLSTIHFTYNPTLRAIWVQPKIFTEVLSNGLSNSGISWLDKMQNYFRP